LNEGYLEDLSTTDSWNPPQNPVAEPENSRDDRRKRRKGETGLFVKEKRGVQRI
jgi:hypothetical protein